MTRTGPKDLSRAAGFGIARRVVEIQLGCYNQLKEASDHTVKPTRAFVPKRGHTSVLGLANRGLTQQLNVREDLRRPSILSYQAKCT